MGQTTCAGVTIDVLRCLLCSVALYVCVYVCMYVCSNQVCEYDGVLKVPLHYRYVCMCAQIRCVSMTGDVL